MTKKQTVKAAPSDDIATSLVDDLIKSGHARRLRLKIAPYTERAIIRVLDKNLGAELWTKLGVKFQDLIWSTEAVTLWTAEVGSSMPVRLEPGTFPVIAPAAAAAGGQVLRVVGVLKWDDLNQYDGA